jgi:amino acid transporter
MFWNRIFATKTLEMLDAEAKGDNRLRRVLGPVGLTSLGVGAIIGAGIFVMTGRVAAEDAGPGVLLSYAVAGVACALAAFCYSEFASMAPVAGSAYTYAYATLGELFAWIIGWDLILEYAMSAATVASVWSNYLNKLLKVLHIPPVPDYLCSDPFSTPGAIMNLPAVLILMACTAVLVIGIRESAASNTALVLLKLGVVVFVIIVGAAYVNSQNWFDIPAEGRRLPEQKIISKFATNHAKLEHQLLTAAEDWTKDFIKDEKTAKKLEADTVKVDTNNAGTKTLVRDKAVDLESEKMKGDEAKSPLTLREEKLARQALAAFIVSIADKDEHTDSAHWKKMRERYVGKLPTNEKDKEVVAAILRKASEKAPEEVAKKWGLIAEFGITDSLKTIDNQTRSNFMPYGFSGVMLGAALVFFAFIGFDSISTHSEEAIKPQRDVPIGILASLGICTVLYIAVSAVITGMVPYYDIDTSAAIASAFTDEGEKTQSWVLNAAGGLIAAGALAGMTSVLLITFLSQARIFLAMARDGLMPHAIFGAVHEKFKTPHVSTVLTGTLMSIVSAFTPIYVLEEMVNIGTLFAFVVVCAAVLILRIKRPEAHRPFRCPIVFVVAPLGILVNLTLMFFLPVETWQRLVYWLLAGLVIYFFYGYHNSVMRHVEAGTNGPDGSSNHAPTTPGHTATAIKE